MQRGLRLPQGVFGPQKHETDRISVNVTTRPIHIQRQRSTCCQVRRPTPQDLADTETNWQRQLQPTDTTDSATTKSNLQPFPDTASYSDEEGYTLRTEGYAFDKKKTTTIEQQQENTSILAKANNAWDTLPARYKVIIATSFSFVICNMDKVNISVAIIPMAQDFGWSPTTAGLVQSAFFYGYMVSQVPGGYISSILGGRIVLPLGVGLWSAATAAVPIVAGTMPGLFLSRAAVGLGEGVAPSAAVDIVASSIDKSERARAISLVFGGLHVGSLLGLLVAPLIIEEFGWPAVFYVFGGVGLLWTTWWQSLMNDIIEKEPEVAAKMMRKDTFGSRGGLFGVVDKATSSVDALTTSTSSSKSSNGSGGQQLLQQTQQQDEDDNDSVYTDSHGGHAAPISATQPVPWKKFLKNKAVLALAYTHFCNNWFHYTMLAWLPTYFTETLSLDLTKAAQLSILPPIAAIAASAIAGPTADSLITRGVDLTTVRKAAQSMAFLGPAACLTIAANSPEGPTTVGLVTVSLGLASFSLAGLYCNHADLSPKYAPVLLGMTNTAGALPGVIGVASTGWLYDITGSWPAALFVPSIFFFLTGTAVYTIFGSGENQGFEEMMDGDGTE